MGRRRVTGMVERTLESVYEVTVGLLRGYWCHSCLVCCQPCQACHLAGASSVLILLFCTLCTHPVHSHHSMYTFHRHPYLYSTLTPFFPLHRRRLPGPRMRC